MIIWLLLYILPDLFVTSPMLFKKTDKELKFSTVLLSEKTFSAAANPISPL
jgi:hypothetical protein